MNNLFITLLAISIIASFSALAGESSGLGSPTNSRVVMQLGESSGLGSPTNNRIILNAGLNSSAGLYGLHRLHDMIIGNNSESTNFGQTATNRLRTQLAAKAQKQIQIDTIAQPIRIRHNGEMVEIEDIERIKLLSGEELLQNQLSKRPAQFKRELLEQIDYFEISRGEVIFPAEIQQALD